MRVSYDPEADALYVRLTDAAVDTTEEVAPNVMLDRDANGGVIGIEVLAASSKGIHPLSLTLKILRDTDTRLPAG